MANLRFFLFYLYVYNVQCIPVQEFYAFNTVQETSATVSTAYDASHVFIDLNQEHYFNGQPIVGAIVSVN